MTPDFGWWPWDAQAVLAVQQALAAWLGFWKTITWLGDELFYLLAFPLIYWVLSPRLGLRAGLVLLASAQVNAALKLLFHQPRPFWVMPEIRGLVEATSFGVPSGHAQTSMAVWGRLAWPWGRRARAAALALSLLIGLSRVVLGVHFWTDVVVGWVLGGLLLAAALFLETRLREAPPARLLLLAAGLPVAALVVGGWARAWWMPASPTAWTEAWSWKPLVGTAAAWMGMVAGALWTARRGGLATPHTWRARLLRVLVGLAGVVALWFGLRALFPGGEDLLALLARGVRYGLVGFWVTGLAPALFRRGGF